MNAIEELDVHNLDALRDSHAPYDERWMVRSWKQGEKGAVPIKAYGETLELALEAYKKLQPGNMLNCPCGKDPDSCMIHAEGGISDIVDGKVRME